MKKQIKNLEASVKGRLLKIARDSGRDFNSLLLLYFQERLLYRLSISPYKLNFVLKGALLFLVYEIQGSRPTKDIDFLGVDTLNTEKNLLKTMKEVITIQVEDGVWFDPDSLDSEVIKEDSDYQGIRIHCTGYLSRANRRFHFDIGFGDIIVPDPVSLDFPTLLSEMSCPRLIAYTPESAIAEKFEAIVKLGLATSRMKDFYDIYHLASHRSFESGILREALETTFNNRNTRLSNRSEIYTENFIDDPVKHQQWKAFIRRMKIETDLTFPECVEFIKSFIEPLFESHESKIWITENMIWKNGGIYA